LSTTKRATELGRSLEIEPQGLAEFDVVARCKTQRAGVGAVAARLPSTRGRPAAQLHVGAFVGTQRHLGLRQVGQRQQHVLQLGLNLLQPRGRALQRCFDLGHFDHCLLGRGVLALAFEHADLFGAAVALRLQIFGLHLQGFALMLERAKGLYIEEGLRVFAGLQALDDGVEVFAQVCEF